MSSNGTVARSKMHSLFVTDWVYLLTYLLLIYGRLNVVVIEMACESSPSGKEIVSSSVYMFLMFSDSGLCFVISATTSAILSVQPTSQAGFKSLSVIGILILGGKHRPPATGRLQPGDWTNESSIFLNWVIQTFRYLIESRQNTLIVDPDEAYLRINFFSLAHTLWLFILPIRPFALIVPINFYLHIARAFRIQLWFYPMTSKLVFTRLNS